MNAEGSCLQTLAQEVLQDRDLRPCDIPDLDLYMDQIITLFEARISGGGHHAPEKPLTKTMINNYSKEGLIQPIKGKKYSREHILEMLLIYHLKQVLSIGDIKTLLARSRGNCDVEAVYSNYLTIKGHLRETLPQTLPALLGNDTPDPCNEAQRLLLVLSLCGTANYLRRMAEELLDESGRK